MNESRSPYGSRDGGYTWIYTWKVREVACARAPQMILGKCNVHLELEHMCIHSFIRDLQSSGFIYKSTMQKENRSFIFLLFMFVATKETDR